MNKRKSKKYSIQQQTTMTMMGALTQH